MTFQLFLRGRLSHPLSPDQLGLLDSAVSEIKWIEPRRPVVRRGATIENSCYLISGTMLRTVDGPKGERQILEVSVPGDFVDLHGFAMGRLDHDVSALDRCQIALLPHARLQGLVARDPVLTRILWYSTLLDAAMHREWIFRLGRLNAEGRIAHLVCELMERMRMVGLYKQPILPIPLMQRDYAEACGITVVHANRVFRQLREAGLIRFAREGVVIENEPQLRVVAEFDPSYLYAGGGKLLAREAAGVR